MTMGIKRRLMEMIPEILEVEQITEETKGIELTEENVDQVGAWDNLLKPQPLRSLTASQPCSREHR